MIVDLTPVRCIDNVELATIAMLGQIRDAIEAGADPFLLAAELNDAHRFAVAVTVNTGHSFPYPHDFHRGWAAAARERDGLAVHVAGAVDRPADDSRYRD